MNTEVMINAPYSNHIFFKTDYNYLYLKEHRTYLKCIHILNPFIRFDFGGNIQSQSIK